MTAKGNKTTHSSNTKHAEAEMRETQHRDGTKTATAHKIWDDMLKENPNMSRSAAIEAAQKQAGMTPASAGTLYQNWRDERGLVNHPETNNAGQPTGHKN